MVHLKQPLEGGMAFALSFPTTYRIFAPANRLL